MNEQKIVEKLLEHDEELRWIRENMATRDDIRGIMSVLDVQTVILKRVDENQTFTDVRLRRLENRMDAKDEYAAL